MKIENKMKQREIKFRMWNQHSKTEGLYIYSLDEVYECIKQQIRHNNGERMGFDHNGCGSIFEQWTGLTDKNGVDIYEGDICELEVEFQGVYNEYYEEPAFHHILTGVVKYMPSTGYYLSIFKAVDVDTGEDIYHPKRKEIVQYRTKLIGNIHEHKHLLK